MKMKVSKRIDSIEESGTVKLTPVINRLREQGKKIINLAVGEPDFKTPKEIIKRTKEALDFNKTRYDAAAGLDLLREKIAGNYDCKKENVIITNGSKQALYSTFQVILDSGDEVVILNPYWVTFTEQVKLAGGEPVIVDTTGHRPDIELIKKNITKKTKAVIINSPNNPTGAVYTKQELEKIANLVIKHNLFVVSDETYDELIYDDKKHFRISDFSEKLKKQTISVNSFSKIYSMTGFRTGFAAADEKIIDKMRILQSHLCGNVCTFAQYGALAAFDLKKKYYIRIRKELEEKRDYAYRRAKELFGCVKPEGAFYLFAELSENISSERFAKDLLKMHNVCVVPGEVFGSPGHIRISFAASMDDIKKGFDRIKKASG
ncbi:aminotransferase class I/II-fold pyridoxal phosphate-dependent enzyme [Candidatus Woesearchaeota archaeon]|nr:aminotransferase class I/II-fold pyridoxal phosphate-dependent enzyme [Candidatus Woesearchaeota archaeon]